MTGFIHRRLLWVWALLLGAALLLPGSDRAALAEELEVNIAKGISQVVLQGPDGEIIIQRDQDQEAVIDPAYAKTSRACPPFCIQPMQVAPGVTTVGELELLAFLEQGGKLIDGRTINWFAESTIPGAINIPYTEAAQRLDELGCSQDADLKWDCAEAEKVLLFCNGPWCGQSPAAIRAMLREGYPAEQIMYYRGGMQAWTSLGLTTVEGDF
ncbi:rhodanese-like domain-containing protein [Rhodovibrionaceae bacterium A322]